jgi:hypothetical protein
MNSSMGTKNPITNVHARKKIDYNFFAVREYVGYICVIYLDMWHGGGGKVSMFGADFILA